MVHDVPTRKCPADALELVERARGNNMLIDLRSLGDPDAPAIAQEVAAPDPVPATFWWEPEVEPASSTLTDAPMTNNAMSPTVAPAQSIATGARRGRQRIARVRLLLCLSVLVVLCLGVLAVLGLGTWGVTDISSYMSLGL